MLVTSITNNQHPPIKKKNIPQNNNQSVVFTGQSENKVNVNTLKAYFLTKPVSKISFCAKPTYKLNKETKELEINLNTSDKAVLHWGINGWKMPPLEIWPAGSVEVKGAVQTPLSKVNNSQSVIIPKADQIQTMEYVVFYPEKNDWDNNNKKNYQIKVAAELNQSAPSGKGHTNDQGSVDELKSTIAQNEDSQRDGSLNWNIATRFQWVSEVLREKPLSKPVLGLLATYVDYAVNNIPFRRVDESKGIGLEATRKDPLRFGHLAKATEELGYTVSETLVNNPELYPEIRFMFKNLQGASGNLESLGSFIQKESLGIVRDDRWRSIESYRGGHDGSGTYLFQLQRKLHSAMSAYDAQIMDAYIHFLKTGGNQESYKNELRKYGIDPNGEEYKKYFTSEPIYHTNDRDGLIGRIEKLRDAVTKFFEGPALNEYIDSLNGKINGDLTGKLRAFAQSDKQNAGAVIKDLAQIRTELQEVILTNKDPNAVKSALLLDIKLEESGKSAIKTALSKMPKNERGEFSLNKQNLQLVSMIMDLVSCDRVEKSVSDELKLVKKDLSNQINSFNPSNKDWNLKTKSIFDRVVRVLGKHGKNTADLFQQPAVDLAKTLDIKNEVSKEFTEHILRLETNFDLSRIMQDLRRETRRNASLPPWDLVCIGKTQGKVIVADTIYDLPDLKGHKTPIIAVLNKVTGSEDIPPGVKGIICSQGVDVLSHLGIRARQDGVILAVSEEAGDFNKIKSELDGKLINLEGNDTGVKYFTIDKIAEPAKSEVKPKEQITITPMNVKHQPVLSKDYTMDTVGPKSYNLGLLAKRITADVKIPASISIPCGMLVDVLNAPENKAIAKEYAAKIAQIDKIQTRSETEKPLKELRNLVRQLKIPASMESIIKDSVKANLKDGPKMARSSYNGEDLEKYAGAGLYDSYPSLKDSELLDRIKDVWASKWNHRAYWSRRENNISHEAIQPTVLIQELIPVDHSFVIHTVHPITNNKNEVFIQMAQGFGEAIVSGKFPGQPYTFVYNRQTDSVERTGFADKNEKMVVTDKGINRVLGDYSDDVFAKDKKNWEDIVKKIAKTSLEIETKWGNAPQDIEGGVKDNEVYILQTRNQVFNS